MQQRHFATTPPAAAKQATKPPPAAGGSGFGSGFGSGLVAASGVLAIGTGVQVYRDDDSRAAFDLLRADPSPASAWDFAKALLGQQEIVAPAAAPEPVLPRPNP